jgi:hypothetical protein
MKDAPPLQRLALGIPRECRGRLQSAHVIPVTRMMNLRDRAITALATGRQLPDDRRLLASTSADDLIADARNGKMLCELHHGLTEGGATWWLSTADLVRLVEFAMPLGLIDDLEAVRA